MAKRRSHPRLYELAKRGAEVQLRELVAEMKLILGFFPHLRDSFDRDELPIKFIMARSSGSRLKKTRGSR